MAGKCAWSGLAAQTNETEIELRGGASIELQDITLAGGRKNSSMRKILIIKTSSLGDVVHNFPAISDIKLHLPNAVIDWVVEESYLPLVRLHPGVRRAIPVAIRRWRTRPLKVETWTELGSLRSMFRRDVYDDVIDTQGLIKSGLLAYAAQGRRHGYDAASAREPIAARFYDERHHVARGQHAVTRNRELVSHALNYRMGGDVDYGLTARAAEPHRSKDFMVVLLHSTSQPEKHWAERNWIELSERIAAVGGHVILPWGSAAERLRSDRIAASLKDAIVPEALTIEALADLLANCRAVAGVDTGLTHLAAALGTPVAAIFCATDSRLTGVFGAVRARNLGGPGRPPGAQEVFDALQLGEVV